MCGFVGIATTDPNRDVSYQLQLAAMNDSLAHRGPDEQGVKIFRTPRALVAMGHRRLSIVDLQTGGQPMANEDRSVWIVYNGEVYNHVEVRQELESKGHTYRTRSDTETILHAYEQWGTECVHRLNGMFAFLIWDTKSETLFAARDRLGIKPFYFAQLDRTLLCASEAKALLASGWIEPRINLNVLPEYLAFGATYGAETLFQRVCKLLPGHWLLWKNGKLQISQYWDVPAPETNGRHLGVQEYAEEFMSLFEDSVKKQLMADVPLGVFLSGGLDSSSIAAVMAKHITGKLKTFSVGFEQRGFNEFSYARKVASMLGAEHHEVVLNEQSFQAMIPESIWHHDEPIRFASSISLYAVAKLARQHVKVVLTGEGSDELFAGYDKYWAVLWNLKWGPLYERLFPAWFRNRCVRATLWNWPLPLNVKKKLGHTFLNHSMHVDEIVFDNFFAVIPTRLRGTLLTTDAAKQLVGIDAYCNCRRYFYSRSERNQLERLLYLDQKTYLVDLLSKQDKMSMAASIESRVPFLDHRLVEFAASVPAQYKVCGRRVKYLVKRAMKGILPKSVLTRDKMGFPVPLRYWLRRASYPMARSILLSEASKARAILNTEFVQKVLEEHRHGARDHTERLWNLINFELWARIFIDGESPNDLRQQLHAATQQS